MGHRETEDTEFELDIPPILVILLYLVTIWLMVLLTIWVIGHG